MDSKTPLKDLLVLITMKVLKRYDNISEDSAIKIATAHLQDNPYVDKFYDFIKIQLIVMFLYGATAGIILSIIVAVISKIV